MAKMEGIHNGVSPFFTDAPANRLDTPVSAVPLERPLRLEAMLPVTYDVYRCHPRLTPSVGLFHRGMGFYLVITLT